MESQSELESIDEVSASWNMPFDSQQGNVTSVALWPKSGSVIATAGEDKNVKLWNLEKLLTGDDAYLTTLSGLRSPAEALTICSSADILAAGSKSGIIKLFDMEKETSIRNFTGHKIGIRCVEFYEDECMVSGSADTNIKVWDTSSKDCCLTFKGHSKAVNSVCISPDLSYIASAGEDGHVKIWDIRASKLVHSFTSHKGPVNVVKFHPEQFVLISGSADRSVKYFDLEKMKEIGSVARGAIVKNAVFSEDDGTLYAAGNEMLKVFGLTTVEDTEVVHGYANKRVGWGSNVTDMVINEHKQLIASTFNQSTVTLFVEELEMLWPHQEPQYPLVKPQKKLNTSKNRSTSSCKTPLTAATPKPKPATPSTSARKSKASSSSSTVKKPATSVQGARQSKRTTLSTCAQSTPLPSDISLTSDCSQCPKTSTQNESMIKLHLGQDLSTVEACTETSVGSLLDSQLETAGKSNYGMLLEDIKVASDFEENSDYEEDIEVKMESSKVSPSTPKPEAKPSVSLKTVKSTTKCGMLLDDIQEPSDFEEKSDHEEDNDVKKENSRDSLSTSKSEAKPSVNLKTVKPTPRDLKNKGKSKQATPMKSVVRKTYTVKKATTPDVPTKEETELNVPFMNPSNPQEVFQTRSKIGNSPPKPVRKNLSTNCSMDKTPSSSLSTVLTQSSTSEKHLSAADKPSLSETKFEQESKEVASGSPLFNIQEKSEDVQLKSALPIIHEEVSKKSVASDNEKESGDKKLEVLPTPSMSSSTPSTSSTILATADKKETKSSGKFVGCEIYEEDTDAETTDLIFLEILNYFYAGRIDEGVAQAIHFYNLTGYHEIISIFYVKIAEVPSVWSLDMCCKVLPTLKALLTHKKQYHVSGGLKALMIIVQHFGEMIKNCATAPKTNVGEDIAGAERRKKCEECLEYLIELKQYLPENSYVGDCMRHDMNLVGCF